jgi:hypothetical protein
VRRPRRGRIDVDVHRHCVQHVDQSLLEKPGIGELRQVATQTFWIAPQEPKVRGRFTGQRA